MSWYQIINDDCQNIIADIVSKNDTPIIVSDPPFNINYHYNNYNDNMDEVEYFNMLKTVFSLCPSVVIHYPESLYKLSLYLGKCTQKVVSWVYNSPLPRQHRDIVFFDVKPDFKKVKQPYKNLADKRIQKYIENGSTGARLYDWWDINQIKNISKEKTCHPCQMPLEVMKNIIGILPDEATIIDPFMGSGTTGVACMELNRNFIGIEIDKVYCEIAHKRIMDCNVIKEQLFEN